MNKKLHFYASVFIYEYGKGRRLACSTHCLKAGLLLAARVLTRSDKSSSGFIVELCRLSRLLSKSRRVVLHRRGV